MKMTGEQLSRAGGDWDLATWRLMCAEDCVATMLLETRALWDRIYQEGDDRPEGHPAELFRGILQEDYYWDLTTEVTKPEFKRTDSAALVVARLLRGVEVYGSELRFGSAIAIDTGFEKVFGVEGLGAAKTITRLSPRAWDHLEGQLMNREKLEPSLLPRERLTPHCERCILVDWTLLCDQITTVSRRLEERAV
jgi:hypothetical protein